MKIPLSWLKEYVPLTLPVSELAQKLTLAGFEVEDIQTTGGNWQNIVIGQITAINPHPNADRLRLATVDYSTGQETVVCGAPNLTVGDKIAFAKLGAELTDPHTGQKVKLKTAKIRGVASSGMVVSEKELGISENHEGIMVLPPDAPLGTALADYLGETVFDVAVTPNRPDGLSVIGIAHEIAALTGQKVNIPEVAYAETQPLINGQVSVEISDVDLCPRYCATLITGVKIAPSPKWLQDRLIACGARPINNIVDITNYVMLEYGQPMHSFDYDRIRQKKIIVRRARDGESIIALDGTECKLTAENLMIADAERTVGVAGVMGGANSEVTEGTTTILLEAASFKPASIYYTSRKLNLLSEASMRYERGIRAELTLPALKHATQLIAELGGGKVAQGIIDVYPGKKEALPIKLTAGKVNRTLALDLSVEQITNALTALGFECRATGEKELAITVPYWRSDIKQAIDLVEEVARVIGYDNIPLTMLSEPIPRQDPNPQLSLKRKVRQALAGYGFQEIISFSLTSKDLLDKLMPEPHKMEPAPLRLVNPMTADLEYLRPNLRANLLTTFTANRRHEEDGIRLFEIGAVYVPRPQNLPDEAETLCGLLCGARNDKSWMTTTETIDFFDAKGAVESLLKQLGAGAQFVPSRDESLHPAKQAAITVNNVTVGIVGELHPRVAVNFEIGEPCYLFELKLADLLPFATAVKFYQPVARFPAVARDIALVVDYNVTHQKILDIIKSFKLVSEVSLFDVYSGKQVAEGKKSLAYRIVYLSTEHTLTDDEVDKVQQHILDRLAKEAGATLRG
ncbi:MAG: phenylalanine--tRNA ligase subunit beta [Dehalococcoidales bacterium]|nr:phenylalanine--tRNA ligase subunit beta [Dehalococcoidales bacterium]